LTKRNFIGHWIVDSLPFLNYVPTFLAPWKKFGDKMYAFEAAIHSRNMRSALSSRSWNWCKQALTTDTGGKMMQLEVAYSIGVCMNAAAYTTLHTLTYFMVAAILHSEIMEKAREELDCVVGPERLPTINDKDKLPYVQAIVNETLRWLPALVSSLPHSTCTENRIIRYNCTMQPGTLSTSDPTYGVFMILCL
jgi:hypothetical protein